MPPHGLLEIAHSEISMTFLLSYLYNNLYSSPYHILRNHLLYYLIKSGNLNNQFQHHINSATIQSMPFFFFFDCQCYITLDNILIIHNLIYNVVSKEGRQNNSCVLLKTSIKLITALHDNDGIKFK